MQALLTMIFSAKDWTTTHHRLRMKQQTLNLTPTDAQDTFEKEAILDRLMKKTTLADWAPGTEGAKQLAKVRRIPESCASIYLKDLHALTLQVQNKGGSFTEQMTRLVKQVLVAHFSFLPCVDRATLKLSIRTRRED
jgi:hypothetical protein